VFRRQKTGFEKSAKNFTDAGDYDKAKAEYIQVLRLDPKNVTALSQLGMIWMEQGVPLRAMEYLPEASRPDPKNQALRLNYSRALMVGGQTAQGLRAD